MDTPSVPIGIAGYALPFPIYARPGGGLDLTHVTSCAFRVFQPDGLELTPSPAWTGALDTSTSASSGALTCLYTFAGTEFGYPADPYPGTWRIAPVLFAPGGPPAGYAVEGCDLLVKITP